MISADNHCKSSAKGMHTVRKLGPSCSTILFTVLQKMVRCGIPFQEVILLCNDIAAQL